jgi:FkbM family methyltransferase
MSKEFGAFRTDMLSRYIDLLKYQTYKSLSLKSGRYKVRGYTANRMALDFSHEAFLVPVLSRILARSSGAIVDVGVNVGQTFLKVISLDAGRRYVGFEPQIDCCFFVGRFIRDNNIVNACVLPMALAEQNGLLPLYSGGSCDELASLVAPSDIDARSGRIREWVNCRVGDEVLAELNIDAIAAIKVDVEGAELQVLRGLTRTLDKHKPALIFEVLPNFDGPHRVRKNESICALNTAAADQLMEFLIDVNYSVFQIDSQGNESKILRFNLDDSRSFVSSDFVAYPQ